MKNILLIICLSLILGQLSAQSVQWAGKEQYSDWNISEDIYVDSEENLFTITNYTCTHDSYYTCPNDHKEGSSISKYDPFGTLIWNKAILSGGNGTIGGGTICGAGINNDNQLIVAGVSAPQILMDGNTYTGGSYIATFDLVSGSLINIKLYPDISIFQFAMDEEKNYYVAGYFKDTAIFESVTLISTTFSPSVFVSKFNSSGTSDWTKQTNGHIRMMDLKVDSNKNIYILGSFFQFSMDGVNYMKSGSKNGIILKLDTNGDLQWVQNIGTSTSPGSEEEIGCIAIDNNENVYAYGSCSSPLTIGSYTLGGSGNTYFAKFNRNGACTFAENVDYRAISVELTANDLIVAGYGSNFHQTALSENWQDGDGSFFIIKCDTNFVVDWTVQPTGNVGFRARPDLHGNVYFFGHVNGPAMVGSHSVVGPPEMNPAAYNNYDMIIAKINDETFVGIKPIQPEESDLKIYPTPTNGEFQMSYISTEKSDLTIKILDNKGALIYFETIKSSEGVVTQSFDLSKYPKGIYTFLLSDKKEQTAKKIVLQ
ncbi:MAG TPA: T9SS type A sorting domain-containing protein [Bacteroidia bacterium]|jgi:hypothetical protein